MIILKSPLTNPYANLAMEDYLLRSAVFEKPLLFLYINRPCVVYGHFQNPWRESDVSKLVDHDLWPVRRLSGGGTVYQDEGNLNFSFITNEKKFDRDLFLPTLIEALACSGIKAFTGPRHDLWIRTNEGDCKITGSAFKHTKFGWYHHGTLLIEAKVELLKKILFHTSPLMETKALPSVRSPVVNLKTLYPDFSADVFIKNIQKIAGGELYELTHQDFAHPRVVELFYQLMSEEWQWFETPRFELNLMRELLTVEKGIVSPWGQTFTRNGLKDRLSGDVLDQWLPDFSEQRKCYSHLF